MYTNAVEFMEYVNNVIIGNVELPEVEFNKIKNMTINHFEPKNKSNDIAELEDVIYTIVDDIVRFNEMNPT